MFAGLDRPVETDQDVAELEVDFCRAVAGSRFGFDEQYYRDVVAADLARGMNPAANAPSASSRVDGLARIRVPTLVVHGTEDPVYPYDHAEVLAKGIPTATSSATPPPLGYGLTVGPAGQGCWWKGLAADWRGGLSSGIGERAGAG